MTLLDLPIGALASVIRVIDVGDHDAIARRLRELGFMPGEPVRVKTTGPFGAEPLLVEVGSTRFALRRREAARVEIAA